MDSTHVEREKASPDIDAPTPSALLGPGGSALGKPDMHHAIEGARSTPGPTTVSSGRLQRSATAGLHVQAKLTVGAADDVYEREADAVAAKVVRSILRSSAPADEQHSEHADETDRIRLTPISSTVGAEGGKVDDETARRIDSARSSGAPLDGDVRRSMEEGFGADFSAVRIHTGSNADELNSTLQAKAFTTGSDIFFRSGDYQPSTEAGQHLLAHELTHVVQQGGAEHRAQRETIAPEEDVALSAAPPESVGSIVARLGQDLGGDGGGPSPAPPVETGATTGVKDLASMFTRGAPGQAPGGPATRETVLKQIKRKIHTHGVTGGAVANAQMYMNEVFGGLPTSQLDRLRTLSVDCHIIPADKKMTDLDEFKALENQQTFDGRWWRDVRGIYKAREGNSLVFAVAEELLGVEGGGGYGPGFVATHEGGHALEYNVLKASFKQELTRIYTARKGAMDVVRNGPPTHEHQWLQPAWYSASNQHEYFANGVAAWYGHPYSNSDESKERYTRSWLKANDPALHDLLAAIYGKTDQV